MTTTATAKAKERTKAKATDKGESNGAKLQEPAATTRQGGGIDDVAT
jgi:hypothetical protein